MLKKLLEALLRMILGGIFIYAAVPKICSPEAFAETVLNYRILPEILANPAAVILPWLELTTGILLVSGIWAEGALVIYNILMAAFIFALAFNTARGLDISCGCFYQGSGEILNLGTILRDLLIFIPSSWLLYRKLSKQEQKKPR